MPLPLIAAMVAAALKGAAEESGKRAAAKPKKRSKAKAKAAKVGK